MLVAEKRACLVAKHLPEARQEVRDGRGGPLEEPMESNDGLLPHYFHRVRQEVHHERQHSRDVVLIDELRDGGESGAHWAQRTEEGEKSQTRVLELLEARARASGCSLPAPTSALSDLRSCCSVFTMRMFSSCVSCRKREVAR